MIIDFKFEDVKKFLPKRDVSSNKYDSGQLLIIGGDEKYPGAIILAAQMALKSGVGLTYLYTKSQNVIKVLKEFPEIIVFDNQDRLAEILSDNIPILAGPGTLNNKWTRETYDLIKDKPITTILDAAYIEQVKIYNSFKAKILLPHEGEAAKLLGISSQEIKDNRVKSILTISNKYNSYVILKGYRTLISDGKKVYRCMNGDSKLSTAGTGDVLAGLVGGLMAQGLEIMQCCQVAVALHGSSSDDYSHSKNLIASELVDQIRIKMD